MSSDNSNLPQSELPPEDDVGPAPSAALGPPLVFSTLSHGEREVIIEHHGQYYRLRVTRNDKLILSK